LPKMGFPDWINGRVESGQTKDDKGNSNIERRRTEKKFHFFSGQL